MSNKRDLQLDQYGISKHRYRELYNFCMQYKEFIAEKQSCYSIDGVKSNGINNGKPTSEPINVQSNHISDPTARKAEQAYKLSKNIELIERTAIEAAGELYPWVLKAVTEDLSFNDLNPPCYAHGFRETKRRFYYLLSLKK